MHALHVLQNKDSGPWMVNMTAVLRRFLLWSAVQDEEEDVIYHSTPEKLFLVPSYDVRGALSYRSSATH